MNEFIDVSVLIQFNRTLNLETEIRDSLDGPLQRSVVFFCTFEYE